MKLCTFETTSTLGTVRRVGALTGGGAILDLNLAYAAMLAERDGHPRARELADVLVPADMSALVDNQHFGLDAAREALAHFDAGAGKAGLTGPGGEVLTHDPAAVRLLSPLTNPRSIRDCMGFEEHVVKAYGNMGAEVPPVWYELPLYYKGNVNSVAGPDADVLWPDWVMMLDYELELAAVIGKPGRDIPAESAWDHIMGYTVFNDVSARDIQGKEMAGGLGPTKGKDLDGHNTMGPYLVTPDEFDPREPHAMLARVNGEEWSRGDTNTAYYTFADLIAYISRDETLLPGDVIVSGTVGTGCGMELLRFPQPGDVIELEVEGIGVLRNRFVKAG